MWGRERDWTDEEKADALLRIYENVASGISVSRTLRELENMPSSGLFWGKWHFEDADIQSKLAHARVAGVEAILEDARDIADTPQMGYIVTSRPVKQGDETVEVEETKREDMLGHRKLQVETRIKYAQMIAPRKYGPKMDLTTGGEKLSSDSTDIAARTAALMALAEQRKKENKGG